MSSFRFILLLLIFILFDTDTVRGDFTVQFQFHSYSNPTRQLANGKCCDWLPFLGCRTCDTLFTSVCLRQDGTCISGTNHNVGRVGDDIIEFSSTIGTSHLSNPFSYMRSTSIHQGGYQLYISVYDDDLIKDDFIDNIIIQIPGHPSSAQSATYTGVYKRAKLVLSYRLSCAQHYYRSDCSAYCIPRNDAQYGHYTCNTTTGAIICRDGWQNTTNYCKDVACHMICHSQGGQCTPNGICQCNSGWSGQRCNIPQCAQGCHPQGGYCSVPNQCLCHANWNGSNCDMALCAVNCSTVGGICNVPNECTCLAGYTGPTCHTDMLPCNRQVPCKNGATCIHTTNIGEYICNCATGYTGTNCEIDIDECSMEPCHNNGTCINGDPGSYRCICTTGWSGVTCTDAINYCQDSPCTNNGTCTNLPTGYYCQCPIQYEGLNCELLVNPCNPNPCQNNGTCTNLITNYTCTCTEGYSGFNCDYNSHNSTSMISSYSSYITSNGTLYTRIPSIINNITTVKSSSKTEPSTIKTKFTSIKTSSRITSSTFIKKVTFITSRTIDSSSIVSTSTVRIISSSVQTLKKSSSMAAPVVGGVIGLLITIVAVIIIILTLAWVLKKRRQSRNKYQPNGDYHRVTEVNGDIAPLPKIPADYEQPQLSRETHNMTYNTNSPINHEMTGPINNPVYCQTGTLMYKTIPNPLYGDNTLERSEYKTIPNPLYWDSTLERETGNITGKGIPNPSYRTTTLERGVNTTSTITNTCTNGNEGHTYEEVSLSVVGEEQPKQANNYDYIDIKSSQPPNLFTGSSNTYDYINTTHT